MPKAACIRLIFEDKDIVLAERETLQEIDSILKILDIKPREFDELDWKSFPATANLPGGAAPRIGAFGTITILVSGC